MTYRDFLPIPIHSFKIFRGLVHCHKSSITCTVYIKHVSAECLLYFCHRVSLIYIIVFPIKLLSECKKIEALQWLIRISPSRGPPQNHHLSREALHHAAGRNHVIGALVPAAAVPSELDQVVAAVRQLWTGIKFICHSIDA